jgi:PAS domain-containing protein
MNLPLSSPQTPYPACAECQATFARLVGNLSGFLYRRRHDARWTMELVTENCREVTGYDPHRFIANASLAFGDLIARSDWKRANERVRLAVMRQQRTTIEYLIRTAHGTWMLVEDRLTPVVNAAGQLLAIEGIIDRARCRHVTSPLALTASDEARLAALCTSVASN